MENKKVNFKAFINGEGKLVIDDGNSSYNKKSKEIAEFICNTIGVPYKDSNDKLISFGDTFEISIKKI